MKHTKIISGLLALGCVGVSSCGGEGATSETTVSAETTTETAPAQESVLPEADFGGESLNLYLWDLTTISVDGETGDVINDAVYRRNAAVQDEYNVKFEFKLSTGHGGDYGTWLSTVNASVMADDGSIDLIGGYTYRLSADTINGSFHNLNTIDSIDFSREWWSEELATACNIGDKLFIIQGNIDPDFYNQNFVMFFNKRLAEENKLPDIYALVDSGEWTLDKLSELSKLGAKDLNGDTVFDENDRYGYLTGQAVDISAFMKSLEIPVTEPDEAGLPRLVGLTERYVNAFEKLGAFVGEEHVYYGTENTVDMFKSGRGMFLANRIGVAHTMREMEDDFGIIPYPKWDTAQENYYTNISTGDCTGFAIPISADAEKVGAVLEAMAYYGYRDVLPEYYERALKGKAARDNESERMLDIIFGGITTEFTAFYSYNFGGGRSPSMQLRECLKNGTDLASTWAAEETHYETVIEEIISSLK